MFSKIKLHHLPVFELLDSGEVVLEYGACRCFYRELKDERRRLDVAVVGEPVAVDRLVRAPETEQIERDDPMRGGERIELVVRLVGAGVQLRPFPQDVMELQAYLAAPPPGQPPAAVRAIPGQGSQVPIWLLGSSDYSAQLAAHVGAGFSFAHHFSDFDPVMPMTMYRSNFKPSETRDKPHAILGVHAVAADTEEEAERLASTVDLNFARRRQGHYLPLPSPEEAAAHVYTPSDKALIGRNRSRLVVGDIRKVMKHLEPLIANTQADELMVTTMIFDHDARKHSYELLAKAFGLKT